LQKPLPPPMINAEVLGDGLLLELRRNPLACMAVRAAEKRHLRAHPQADADAGSPTRSEAIAMAHFPKGCIVVIA
jgi:hypothetical protein